MKFGSNKPSCVFHPVLISWLQSSGVFLNDGRSKQQHTSLFHFMTLPMINVISVLTNTPQL